MTQEKTYAWIFLSVGEQPSPLWDVISTADGGNIFDVMDRIAEAFVQLPPIAYQPDDMTEKERWDAYKKIR